MALNIGNLLNNPAAMAQAAQNLADNTGIGDEYREEVSAYNARQEAQNYHWHFSPCRSCVIVVIIVKKKK